MNEAIRDWVTNVRETYYLLGSTCGPHPYPMIVRDFQSIIGEETKEQIIKKERRLPDCLVACVGGGSNAIGLFHPFLNERVRMIGVEAGGEGHEIGKNSLLSLLEPQESCMVHIHISFRIAPEMLFQLIPLLQNLIILESDL